jgi:hypothetical protein
MDQTKKLPVTAVLLGMLAAVIGGGVGAVLGGLIGSLLASAMHVPAREGASGYFTIFIALIAIVIATPSAVILTLYWCGVRRVWLFIGTIASFAGFFLVGAAGFGVWYMAQPHFLNANGPNPRLEFEIKPPAEVNVQTLADVRPELDTDRNVMPADWSSENVDPASGVRAGTVDLAFRTSKRLFVLKFSAGEDRIFNLQLPANPMKAQYRQWSDWKSPDFTAKPGSQPARYTGNSDYQIRYRVEYQ